MSDLPPDQIENVENDAEEAKLSESHALKFALLRERAASAEATLSLRKLELETFLNSLISEYSEAGTYKVTGIDVNKGVVTRVKQAE